MSITCVETEALIEQLFEEQRASIDSFFDTVDLEAVQRFLDQCEQCEGVLHFCGVGKSGIIAEKLAVTLASTGTRAYPLSPTDALHGDLGNVSRGDLVVFLSKSGESDELLNLVPYVRNKGATSVAWVCCEGSRLEQACDLMLHLPLQKELCPFNLAPTTSAALQLILGDIVSVALMRKKEFTLDEYANNHPAGRIGKRIAMRVRDLMLTGADLPLCREEDRLIDCLVTLSDRRCGCLLVLNDSDQMSGIFTDGDLRRALQTRKTQVLDCPLEELMSSPFRSTQADVLAFDAMTLMEADQKHPIMVLPVLDASGHVDGLIKMHDILQSGL